MSRTKPYPPPTVRIWRKNVSRMHQAKPWRKGNRSRLSSKNMNLLLALVSAATECVESLPPAYRPRPSRGMPRRMSESLRGNQPLAGRSHLISAVCCISLNPSGRASTQAWNWPGRMLGPQINGLVRGFFSVFDCIEPNAPVRRDSSTAGIPLAEACILSGRGALVYVLLASQEPSYVTGET